MNEIQLNAFMARLTEVLQGVRQYVGARYVPNFIDDPWNDTTGYEALDVVDNGMGTSYIAKKPVPAGTPLSNREYWFVYGSTSGAIINLQNQIDAIVNNTIPGINSQIQALTNIHHPEKVMLITDSYGNQLNAQDHTIAWIVQEELGVTCSKISVSGGSMHAGEIEAAVNEYSGATDFDTIVIVAGANDQSARNISASIISGITSLVSTIRTKFDPVSIYLMCPGMTFDSTYETYTRIKLAKDYKDGARVANIKFIDNSQYILCSTTLLKSDNCHPNADGVDVLGHKIVEAILNGHNDVIITLQTTGSGSVKKYYMIRHNGHVRVTRQGATPSIVGFDDPIDGTGNTTITFDTLNDSLVQVGGQLGADYVPLFGYCQVNGVEERLSGSLFISNKQIKGTVVNKSYTNSTNNRLVGWLEFDD